MAKKIPTKYEQDDPKSMIRKAQRKEDKGKPIGNIPVVSKDNLKKKGKGGIEHEAKEYIKELKGKSYHAKKGKK